MHIAMHKVEPDVVNNKYKKNLSNEYPNWRESSIEEIIQQEDTANTKARKDY